MYIQKNLMYFKTKLNLTYREISKEAGVNLNSLTRISKGAEDNVTIKTICSLAKYFNVSIDDLVYKDLEK